MPSLPYRTTGIHAQTKVSGHREGKVPSVIKNHSQGKSPLHMEHSYHKQYSTLRKQHLDTKSVLRIKYAYRLNTLKQVPNK